MSSPLLQVINLTLNLHHDQKNTKILDKVNFSVQRGETLALVGESGSGKSLTALAIMQLLPEGITINTSSSILFNNDDLLAFSELKMQKIRGRRIGIIFQEALTALNPVITVGEQILEVISHHFRLSRQAKYERVITYLKEVGFPEPETYFHYYPHQLSGGLRQRAIIAMALAGEPDLLIADEPTTALDVTLQVQILRLLKKIQLKRHMGLLFITHDLGVVYQLADQVAVLYQGEIVESQSVKQFFKEPKHPYSLKLFDSIPNEMIKRPMLENTLLDVQHLKVFYPIKKGLFKRLVGLVKAVDDVNLAIKHGRTLALVGESGSGKTTTGMAILQLTKKTSGRIFFENKEINSLAHQNLRDIQIIFQDPYASLNPRMLVSDIIAEGLYAKKLPKKEIKDRVDCLLEQVGMSPSVKNRYPHEFSGGQRQRICIARALAVEPRLIICDEPTSALDVSAQLQILKLLLKLQSELKLSYLLITHNLAVVSYMADEVAVMHHGKVVEFGDTHSVLTYPQNAYTQKLLKAVPKLPE